MRDYRAWHQAYDDPTSSLALRLRVVQQRLSERISAAPSGRLRLISMCAGQGRDVIPVLASHPRGANVDVVLLEIDPENVAVARRAASAAGISHIEVVETDASVSDAYAPYLPADLVLACGIFGNISDADVERTAGSLSMLCRPGAVVIWTRHRREPDLTPMIRDWLAANGFAELSFDTPVNATKSGIGVAQLRGAPRPFEGGFRFFTFLR